MFFICPMGFKIDFQNRKLNYPNRKWNYFTHLQASHQKTSFTQCSSFIPRSTKLIFKTGNRIIQTGNGIISPTYRPLIKNFFYKMSPICSKWFRIDSQNRKWNIQTGNGIISPTSRPLIKKLLLQNVFNLFQVVQIDF